MLNFISGSGLSVRQRLMTLGAATSLGIGSMLAVGWYENAQVDSALTRALALQNDVEQLNEMQLANSRLVLAAMDTIIDRSEGVIQKERAEIVRSAATQLATGAPIMKSLAQEAGNAALAETYDADLAELVKAIEVDLKRLVETGAPEADYAAIDDAIDGAGDRLSATLDKATDIAGQIMQASVEGATARAGTSLYLQLGLGLLALSTALLLQALHGNAIVNGIRAVRAPCSACSTVISRRPRKRTTAATKSAKWLARSTASARPPSKSARWNRPPPRQASATHRNARPAPRRSPPTMPP